VAIYSLMVQTIGRGQGRSVVAAAAYRSCSSLTDERLHQDFDFTNKSPGLVDAAILTPENAPPGYLDRQTLWNAVERAETRPDATTAREILVALPHELTDEQRRELVEDFARRSLVSRGMIADYAIHRPSQDGDERNHHAHILATTRDLGPEGFGKKNRDWHEIKFVVDVREEWAKIANEHLKRHAPEVAPISEKTLAEQGIDRAPTTHNGPEVTAMERRGERTAKGETNRDIAAENLAAAREDQRMDDAVKKAGRDNKWVERSTTEVIDRMEEARDHYKSERVAWVEQRDAIAAPKPPTIRSVEGQLTAKAAAELKAAQAREDRAKQDARDAGLSAKRLAQWYTNPEKAAMRALVRWNAELDRLAAAKREREAAERALQERRDWLKTDQGKAAVHNLREPDILAAKAATTERRTLDRKIKRMDRRLKGAEKAIEAVKVVDVLGKDKVAVPESIFKAEGRTSSNLQRYFKYESFDAQAVIRRTPAPNVEQALQFVRGKSAIRPEPIFAPTTRPIIEAPSPPGRGGIDR